MRKLQDFETEDNKFKELIEYAKSLDTFVEYDYERIRNIDGMIHTTFKFKNNYGISIINYGYSNADKPFECALIYDNHVTYDEVFEDVFGYCDADKCKALMLYVSKKEDYMDKEEAREYLSEKDADKMREAIDVLYDDSDEEESHDS